MTEGRFDYPLDIALTEFHVLQLYTNRFTAYSTLDKSMVYEDFFHKVFLHFYLYIMIKINGQLSIYSFLQNWLGWVVTAFRN